MSRILYIVMLIALTGSAHAEMRTWTRSEGKTFKGEYVSTSGDKIILRDTRGKTKKFPRAQFSPEDIAYIELSNPPEFKVDFFRQSHQLIIDMSGPPPKIMDYIFGAKIKQASSRDYNHALRIEFFAIGAEVWGNHYILLDRQESSFTPSTENNKSYKFSSEKKVRTIQYVQYGASRGTKYHGNLVTVTDERGEIIAYSASNPWLYDNIENLRQLPIGAYFDKTCTRTYPTPPKLYY